MTDIMDFNKVLNALIDEKFPNTTRYMAAGGDYLKDVVMELREGNAALQYSPYEMFMKSDHYEETIEEFMKRWETMLNRAEPL